MKELIEKISECTTKEHFDAVKPLIAGFGVQHPELFSDIQREFTKAKENAVKNGTYKPVKHYHSQLFPKVSSYGFKSK